MKNLRILLLASSGLLIGCGFFPGDLSQWFSTGLGAGNQSVKDVTPNNIEDPNSPAKESPAATQAPIRIRLSNPTARAADCRITMELIGQQVHFSLRRLLAATDALLIGPDRADIIRIDVTFLGTPPVVLDTKILRIGTDFQPGQLIDVKLALPDEGEEPGKPVTEPPTIAIAGLNQDILATVGDVVTFDIVTTNAATGAVLAVSADPDGIAGNNNEIAIASGLPAAPRTTILWNTAAVAPGSYLIRAKLTQGTTVVIAAPPTGRVILSAVEIFGACCYPESPCEIVTEENCIGGVWLGANTQCDDCPECPVVCPTDSRIENEPCGELVNFGCITTGEPVYEPLTCGETVCGTVWFDLFDPNDPNLPWDPQDPNAPPVVLDPTVYPFDFDFYEFSVGHDAEVSISIESEFPMIAGLLRTDESGSLDCEYLSDNLLDLTFGWPCSPGLIEHCIPAGTYYVLLYPFYSFEGEQTAVPCDGANRYSISLDCQPCEYVSGACCFGDYCTHLSEGDCYYAEGEYQGDGTTCDPNPCVPATGACCYSEFICEEMTEMECYSIEGSYQGDYTTCDPNPCLPIMGACCFPQMSCSVLTFDECSFFDGDYQGDGTTCDPNPCPPPPIEGACCFDGGSCSYITQAECDLEGGVFQGENVSCEPNPCVSVADGDNCDHPIVIVADTDLPYFDANTTCDRGNYHSQTCLTPYDAGEEIVYRIDVLDVANFTITLDPKGTVYTGMALFMDGCPGSSCVQAVDEFGKGLPYIIGCQLYKPGTYYLMIDLAANGGSCIPQFELTINACP